MSNRWRKGLPVNLSAMDSLVLEYMTSEGLVDTCGCNGPAQAANQALQPEKRPSKLDRCHAVRSAIESGNVQEAICIADEIAPDLMKDQRIAFVIKSRKFVELMRRGGKAVHEAIAFARQELIPLAEVAYPEAYLECMKQFYLSITFKASDTQAEARELWSLDNRTSAAVMFSRMVREAAGVTCPKLVLMLRYLAFVHRMLKEAEPEAPELKANDSDIDHIIANLLVGPRDAAPLPVDGPQDFVERDIQALKEAVQLTRPEAIQALKHTHGDVNAALANELAAMGHHVSFVDDLVHSYAFQRKLVLTGDVTSGSSQGASGSGQGATGNGQAASRSAQAAGNSAQAANGSGQGAGGGRGSAPAGTGAGSEHGSDLSMDIDIDIVNVDSPVRTHATGSADATLAQAAGAEANGGCEQVAPFSPQNASGSREAAHGSAQAPGTSGEDSSSSGKEPAAAGAESEYESAMDIDIMIVDSPVKTDVTSSYTRDCNNSPPNKIPRWVGRPAAPQAAPPAPAAAPQRPPPRRRSPRLHPPPPGVRAYKTDAQHEQIKTIADFIEAGNFDKAIESIEGLGSNLLKGDSDAIFALYAARFFQLASAGHTQDAIAFGRAKMSPIAKDKEERTQLLRTTFADVLISAPSIEGLLARLNRPAISVAVTEALELELGLQEPQLVQLLRVLLDSHAAWYRKQRCSDPFEAVLGLNTVKRAALLPAMQRVTGSAAAAPGATVGGPAAAAVHAAAGIESEEEDIDIVTVDAPRPRANAARTEDDILLIMEFTGLSRPAAMDLLAEFGGSAQTALANLYN